MLTSRSVLQRALVRSIAARHGSASIGRHCFSSKAVAAKKDDDEDAISPITEKVEAMRSKNPYHVSGPIDDDASVPAAPLPVNPGELSYMDPADLTNAAARFQLDGTRRTVVIRQETKDTRQAPINDEDTWHIKMSEDGVQSEDWYNSLMGWNAGADPYQSAGPLEFENAAEAVYFAKKRGWKYIVHEPIKRELPSRGAQYQDNFLPQAVAAQVQEEGTSCREWERSSAGTSHYFRPLKYHGDGTVRQHGPNQQAEIMPAPEGYYKMR